MMSARQHARRRRGLFVAAAAASSTILPSFVLVKADDHTHKYEAGESIVVWTDKVGPYHNPQETYPFASMNLCEMQGVEDKIEKRGVTIGEALEGHEFVSSPKLELQFGQSVS